MQQAEKERGQGTGGHLGETQPELVRVQLDLLHALGARVLALLAGTHRLRSQDLVSIESCTLG